MCRISIIKEIYSSMLVEIVVDMMCIIIRNHSNSCGLSANVLWPTVSQNQLTLRI